MSLESEVTSLNSDLTVDIVTTHPEYGSDWLSKLTDSCVKERGIDNSGDILAELEQKEHDLRLAAELGKVLVQENEDLKQVNRQQMESFSQKFEVSSNLMNILKGTKNYTFKSFVICTILKIFGCY
jgi:hypothetical protein